MEAYCHHELSQTLCLLYFITMRSTTAGHVTVLKASAYRPPYQPHVLFSQLMLAGQIMLPTALPQY